ncbi:hypothetical protein [Limnoglobus roseus]|uniref:Uncharacterized protein n=1 Tax=Limnoglobus roseus TaxID=2598579 RepID=A0A5C1AIS9_9BACT|nr:hypothetical protein [Limnoglobus roseus]QEL19071.1 hypothetical protein PX52LOC_06128 [Limnoglobus roseus]
MGRPPRLSDWLEERDDPRAEGYRVLGLLRKWPRKCRQERIWSWEDLTQLPGERMHVIPYRWCDATKARLGHNLRYCSTANRRTLEDATAVAYASLSAEVQKQILWPVGRAVAPVFVTA